MPSCNKPLSDDPDEGDYEDCRFHGIEIAANSFGDLGVDLCAKHYTDICEAVEAVFKGEGK